MKQLSAILSPLLRPLQATHGTADSPIDTAAPRQPRNTSTLDSRLESIETQLQKHEQAHRTILREIGRLPGDVVSLDRLTHHLLPAGEHAVPPVGGFAMRTREVSHLMQLIREHKPTTLVECGSGSSTAWIGLALAANGGGHVYALEQSPEWCAITESLVQRLNVQSWVTVLLAPLEDDDDGRWYSRSALNQIPREIDMLLIDGPANPNGTATRSAALPLMVDRIRDGGLVFLDDTSRPAERDIVRLAVGLGLDVLADSGTSVVLKKGWMRR